MSLPVLIIVPHAGRALPFDVSVEMLGEAAFDVAACAALERELYRQSDPHTDALFYLPGASYLAAHVSRFVVDVNRDRDDMSPGGVVKTVDFDERPLYPEGHALSSEARETRLTRYYDPFHAELHRCIRRYQPRLILDGHSMSARAPRYAPDAGRARPAFALLSGARPGSGAPSLPRLLAERLRDLLYRHMRNVLASASVGADITIDDPWSFDEIATSYAAAKRYALGLEVNRALYLADGGDSDQLIPGRLPAIRAALDAFIRDALVAVEEYDRTT